MREGLSYEDWKSDINIWSDVTELAAEKQGGAVFLTLVGKAQATVRAGVTRAEMKTADGLTKILTCPDGLYQEDAARSAFAAYEHFTEFKRSRDMSIEDYLIEFNIRYSKIKSLKMELPDGVLAYYLLKCASLTEEQSNICKATCDKLTYDEMREKIERVTSGSKKSAEGSIVTPLYREADYFDDSDYQYHYEYDNEEYDTGDTGDGEGDCENDKEEKAYYIPSSSRGGRASSYRHPHQASAPMAPRFNAPDEYGNPSRCSFCKSVYHYIGACPDAKLAQQSRSRGGASSRRGVSAYRGRVQRGGRGFTPKYIWHEDHQNDNSNSLCDTSESVNVSLYLDEFSDKTDLLGETLGHAVIDSGCPKTVCGKAWLNLYMDTLCRSDQLLIEKYADDTSFRFGDKQVYISKEMMVIPIQLGPHKLRLMTSVVETDVPLLISRESLKRASAEIDFKQDQIRILGDVVDVVISKTGHLCVPLVSRDIKQTVKQVLFSCPLQENDDKVNEKKIHKLHKQFAHPKAQKLKELIRNSGVSDKKIEEIVDNVSNNCDTCKRFRRPPLRPVVNFPLASEFNEVVALDIKFIDQQPILHLIDHATRYSMACRLRNKRAETVVENTLNLWIRVFGSPSKYFITDNGGEFVNDELRELCEKFNFELNTTGAEASWSNGLVERHHAMLEDNVRKVMDDSRCSLDIAISWATSAKNALGNVYGFSANQLVFGRNINLPSVHHDKLPAQNESCNSAVISKNLVALHKTRQAFVTQESCERLRRALNRQTRSFSDIVYQTGDKVYFKRNDAKEWHGPAKVLGCEKSQYLLKHGGNYVRVHPSKMQMVHGSDSTGLPGKMLLPTHAHKTCQTDCDNVCVQSTGRNDVSYDPSAGVHDASDNVSDNVVNGSFENVSDNVVVNDDSDNEYDDDDDHGNVRDNRNVPLTPPATPAHRPEEQPAQQHNIDIQPEAVDIQVEQNDIGNDNDEHDSLCVDDPESVRVSRALSRLYDFNKPGSKDITSFPGRRHTRAHTLDDIEEEEEEQEVEEVYFGAATNHARYHQAKLEELQKWQEFNTCEEVPDTGQPRVSCKWVCTEKMKAGVLVTKARLVARGFEEDKSQLRTDSPTCYKDSLRILLSVLSARNWKLKSIDIKSAYLQGNETQREIYLKPPKEANTVNLWKLIRTPYGLVDAGRQWYIRVQKEFTSLGAKQVKCDRAVFVWENPSGSGPCGIILSHVDDFLYGGNSYFLNFRHIYWPTLSSELNKCRSQDVAWESQYFHPD